MGDEFQKMEGEEEMMEMEMMEGGKAIEGDKENTAGKNKKSRFQILKEQLDQEK